MKTKKVQARIVRVLKINRVNSTGRALTHRITLALSPSMEAAIKELENIKLNPDAKTKPTICTVLPNNGGYVIDLTADQARILASFVGNSLQQFSLHGKSCTFNATIEYRDFMGTTIGRKGEEIVFDKNGHAAIQDMSLSVPSSVEENIGNAIAYAEMKDDRAQLSTVAPAVVGEISPDFTSDEDHMSANSQETEKELMGEGQTADRKVKP